MMTVRRRVAPQVQAAFLAAAASLLWGGLAARGDIQIVADRNDSVNASPAFQFKHVPRPARNDAAAKATFSLADGRRDANGGDLARLHDGKVPAEEDAPAESYFFDAGTAGGRLLVDLGQVVQIKQVNTYSWHASTRGPQLYTLYASDGKASSFIARPRQGTDPAHAGWKPVATVDTRPKTGSSGGQYGVSISDSSSTLGAFQFLLFDIARTEDQDPFGNTFFSEIDVIDRNAPPPELIAVPTARAAWETIAIDDGKCSATLDTSATPDLTEWARKAIVPMVQAWYPKLVKLLPSEGYQAPTNFSIIFSKDMQGVAATSGTRIRCAANWFRRNLEGEAVGAVFHEMVHVVQQYGRTRRAPGATRPPGWLTEGITDYLRWFLYEPQSRGAEITRRNLSRARYDGNYRITANFLNWVSARHGPDFITRLNAALRDGKYSEETWKSLTGRTVQELGAAWKAEHEKRLGADDDDASAVASPATAPTASLTSDTTYFPPPESQGGWRKLDRPEEIRRVAGMDPAKLAALREWLLQSDDRNFAAVVIRRGWKVLEVERGNSASTDARRVASVSKAVCATVLAIAADRSQQGLTPRKMRFDDPAFPFIPWAQPLSDPRKARITVRQLLNHTSGLCPEATGAPNDGTWEYILGHTGDARTARLAFDPGTGCGYSTHALAHAALVCETVTGKPYDQFAIEALFKPLGIEHWWFQFYEGGEKYGRHPSHGLGMPARDLARIGYCLAHGGRWQERPVIPKWFVEETAAPTHEVKTPEMRWRLNPQIFSHGWELPARLTGEDGRSGEGIPADARSKAGSGGQLIAFVPNLDLVIARQTGSSGSWGYEEYLRRACAAVERR